MPKSNWTISGFQLQFLIWRKSVYRPHVMLRIPEQTSVATVIVTKYVPVLLCFAEMLTGKYRLKENDGAPEVIQAIDFVDAHMLPYFSQQASIGEFCPSAPCVLARSLKLFLPPFSKQFVAPGFG